MLHDELISILKSRGYAFDREFLPGSLDVSQYLRRHDIVFESPQTEGYEGLPLGNGDISLMLWTQPEGLCLQLNKNDTWTQPDGESPMLLRSCGRINIDFGQPCNDWLYLDDFDARLSLGEAKVRYRTKTPFCSITAEAFVDPETNLLVMDLAYLPAQADGNGDQPLVRISLERYGSRAFPGWYNSMLRDASAGLGRARARAFGGGILVSESFDDKSGLRVAAAARVLGQDCPARLVNPKRAEIEWSVGEERRVTLLVAAASAADQDDAEAVAMSLLAAGEQDLGLIRRRHGQWWSAFWNRSFLQLTDDSSGAAYDYLENLYYLQLYALGSASRGKYPMIFNGGAFTWNRDTRQWVNPHHWNIQQSYWSLDAANRPELMKPYFCAYSRMIPAARQFAAESRQVGRGMIISEMHDFSGRMLSYKGALTPASQIAQQYWNHYLYNLDPAFLQETAYPFIRECADFYAEYARLNDRTGLYEIGPAAVYECEFGEDFTNTVVDMTMMRYILPVAIEAAGILGVDADRTEKWQAVLDHLSDFVYLDGEGPETLAMGLDREGRKADFAGQNTTFCRNAAPLMPCPIIGLKDKGSRLFQAVYHAAEQYRRNSLAITPISVIWARLGDGRKATEFLFNAIAQLQHFPQGFFYNIDHWFQYSRYAKRVDDFLTECQRDYIYDRSLEYADIRVRNSPSGEKVDLPMQPFVQCGFEAAGILVHALQEMMLQCHEQVIRILPACPPVRSCQFTLKAAGNFLVSGAGGRNGTSPLVIIKSFSGGSCTVDVPFAGRGAALCDSRGREQPFSVGQDGFIRFPTRISETYLLYAADLKPDELIWPDADCMTNNHGKQFEQARLGRKRTF